MNHVERFKESIMIGIASIVGVFLKILLDEKTDPYTIHGNNVEDDYGFTWGFNNYQTRWIGCPTHENRGRNDQDGVFYRFFGPDPIAFRSSFSFRAGCRGDDMETVVYYYKMSGSGVPANNYKGL